MEQPASPSEAKSTLAIVALVLGIVGVCFFPLGLIAAVLGIVALVRLPSGHSAKGFAVASIALPVISVPITGILAAIAIPNFIRFQERSKQAECKSNLKALYVAERSYFAEHDHYTEDFSELGWVPERGNRYAYSLSPHGEALERGGGAAAPQHYSRIGADLGRFPKLEHVLARLPKAAAGDVPVGEAGQCPRCSFAAVCAGEPTNALDTWSISTDERAAGPETIPGGAPYHDSEPGRF